MEIYNKCIKLKSDIKKVTDELSVKFSNIGTIREKTGKLNNLLEEKKSKKVK